jgi:phosphodiesterase/alkaline phosphatase D-like protein
MLRIRRLMLAVLATFGVLSGIGLLWSASALALYQSGSPASCCSLAGAQAVAVDQSNGDVYVGNGSGEIKMFNKEGVEQTFTPSESPGYVYQMAVDNSSEGSDPSKGDLYVANFTDQTVYQYTESGTLVKKLEGLGESTAVAVNSKGDVYVGIYGDPGEVLEYGPELEPLNGGAPVLEGTINANALALNTAGDLYVAQNSGGEGTAEYEPEGAGFNATPIGELSLGGPNGSLGVAVDQTNGNVFVDNEGVIDEFSEAGAQIESFGSSFGSNAVAVAEEKEVVYAANSGAGVVEIFVELPPLPVTREAKSITAISALLRGELNPKASATAAYEFMYNITSAGTGCRGGHTTTLGSERTGEAIEVSTPVTGLVPSTEYTFCAVAVSKEGFPAVASPSTFTTAPGAKPEVVLGSEKASGETPFEATLGAQVNANTQDTTVYFQYSTSSAVSVSGSLATPTDVPAPPGSSIGAGFGPVGVGDGTGHVLTDGTHYYYQAVAVNAFGTTYGEVAAFKTLTAEKPKIESEQVSAVGSTGATLEAQVNPEFQESSCEFEYGAEPLLESGVKTAPCDPAKLGSGNGVVGASAVLNALKAGETYYYRVAATNASGTFTDATIEHFTTIPAPSTEAPNPIGTTTATFNGKLTPLGSGATGYFFYYNRGEESACTNENATMLELASTEAVSTVMSGLEPSQKYTVCLVSVNAFGTVEDPKSPPVHFTTKAAPPEVSGESTSGVTPYEATLEAQVNPNNQKTTYLFEYSTTETAKKLTGTIVTLKGEAALEGGVAQTASVSTARHLKAGETYYYRAVAENAAHEKTEGAVEPFTTPAATAPVIESQSSSIQSPFAATLEAQVNPDSQLTSCEFEYGIEPLLKTGVTTKPCNPEALGEGSSGVGVSLALTGLKSKTVYYFRVSATNGTGNTTDPTIAEVETPAAEKPAIESESDSNVTQNGATLEARVNPEYQTTEYAFEYSQEESTVLEGKGAKTHAGSIAAESSSQPVSAEIGGLQPNKLYFYRVVTSNATGATTATETIASFETTSVPILSSNAAQEVTSAGATVSGTVNPEGLPTTYYFQYGQSTAYGSQTASAETPAGTTAQPSATLSGLGPDTTYHYRVVASNENHGTPQIVYGPDMTFTTLATPPILGGTSVSGVSQSAASIEVALDGQGLSTHWELRLSDTQRSLDALMDGNTQSSALEPIVVNASSLTPGTTYYYKLTATNPDGSVETPEGSFTTAPAPAPANINLFATPPVLSIPANVFPAEETGTTGKTTNKGLSKAQKLKDALKACKKDKSKSKRAACEKAAHKKYGATTKKKK